MAVAFKGTATFVDRAGDGALTPAFPASATTNDLAFLVLYLDSGTASGPESAGWTVAPSSPYGTAVPKLYLWYRRLQSGDAAPSITVAASSPSTSEALAGYITYTSNALITPVEASSGGTQGLGTPSKTPSVTSLSASAVLVAFIGRGDDETSASQAIGGSATGVVERVDQVGIAGDDGAITVFDKTLVVAGASGTATAVTQATDPFVGVMVALSPRVEVPVTGVRAAATGSGSAGSPKVTATGTQAAATATAQAGSGFVSFIGSQAAATATAQPGSPAVTVTGARAAATAAAQAGSPVVIVTGSRAAATATAQPGGVPASITIIGVRAAATAKPPTVYAIRLTASNSAGSDAEVKTGYIATGVGAPHVILDGGTARASSQAQAGGGSNALLIPGVRAAAAATGQAGTVFVAVVGGRAVAATNARLYAIRLTATNAGGSGVETKPGYVAAVRVDNGEPVVIVSGARAAATATAQPGGATVGVGAIAVATATGQAGSTQSSSSPTGVRAEATASTTPTGPSVVIGGVRASATATATAGGFDFAVIGVTATATAAGQAGVVLFDIGVVGARALATATANAGFGGVVVEPTGTWKTRTLTGSDRTLVVVPRRRVRVRVANVNW